MHHIASHKQTCIVGTIFYSRETHMGEKPNNLSYEDSLMIIRTSIHHDHEHQTLPHMRVYINRETKYLSFHVRHVATASTLALSMVLVKEALLSSSRTNQHHHARSRYLIMGLSLSLRLAIEASASLSPSHRSSSYHACLSKALYQKKCTSNARTNPSHNAISKSTRRGHIQVRQHIGSRRTIRTCHSVISRSPQSKCATKSCRGAHNQVEHQVCHHPRVE